MNGKTSFSYWYTQAHVNKGAPPDSAAPESCTLFNLIQFHGCDSKIDF